MVRCVVDDSPVEREFGTGLQNSEVVLWGLRIHRAFRLKNLQGYDIDSRQLATEVINDPNFQTPNSFVTIVCCSRS